MARDLRNVFNAPDRFPLRAYTIAWAAAMLFKNVIGYNTMISAQRYFLVKDGREAQKAAWLGFVLIVGGSFVLAGRQGSDVGLVGEKSAD